jgi:hypothetical protein
MYLLVAGRKVPVSHVGPDTIILRSDEFVPNGHAELVISVDGKRDVYHVILSATESEVAELAYA